MPPHPATVAPLGLSLPLAGHALAGGLADELAVLDDPVEQRRFTRYSTGAAGETYELDATTNLAPPIPWVFVTNAVADQNGLFQLWDLSATNFPQRFYRITGSQ